MVVPSIDIPVTSVIYEGIAVERSRVANEKAMTLLNESVPFDLILIDMQMPVMDGCEALAGCTAIDIIIPSWL